MFIGHFGVGFAAKRLAPRVSLCSLFFSAEFLDLLWPIFLLTGLEHMRIVPGITRVSPFDFYDYPISHSLVAVLGWSILVGLLYYSWRLNSGGAWVLGACVAGHWGSRFYSPPARHANSPPRSLCRSRTMEFAAGFDCC